MVVQQPLRPTDFVALDLDPRPQHHRTVRNAYEIGALAAEQAGFFSLDQALEKGMSRGAIRWGIDQGYLIAIRTGLYKVKGIVGDHDGRLRAAMAILPNATASHESAAELLGVPFIPRG